MSSAKVTSKGQITIPVEVRQKLGLQAGSRLTFEATDDGGYEIHAEGSSVRDLKGSVPAPEAPVSLNDMDAAIAAGARASMR
jgi:AbrB family looped-hinge helix DNA binding protein